MAVQEVDRLHLGTCRAWAQDAAGALYVYGQCSEASIDFKAESKEAYAEDEYPFAAGVTRRSIDIQLKNYLRNMDAHRLDLNAGAPVANNNGYAFDEDHAITGGHTVTASNVNIVGAPIVVVGIVTGGVTNPVRYALVAGGAEVAGVSCSFVAATGVFTFAVGDGVGLDVKLTYRYTLGVNSGKKLVVQSNYQNSTPMIQLILAKRDVSALGDNSTGIVAYEFNAVRPLGVKVPYKEGEYTVFERSFKAFRDPMGGVMTVREINE